jgi:hypothetical protein
MTLGALFIGAAALAPSAQAQSCDSVPVVQSSYPADGATGVPTNAPLFIYGPELDADSSVITLEDEGGEAVMFEVSPAPGGLLVDAFLGFDANTTYALSVTSGGEEWSASFTTGAGPATVAQLRAPDVGVSVIEQDLGSCVVSAICVIGEVPPRRALEVVVSGEVLSVGSGEPPPVYPATPGAIGAGACIEVRLREPGGIVSEATRLCGNQLERFELDANATAPTSCRAYAPAPDDDEDSESSSDSGGCALGTAGAAPGAAGVLLGLAALLAARRKTLIGR